MTVTRWVSRIRAAEKEGDLAVAYDLAAQGLREYPDNIDLLYTATRVLARSGALDQAAVLYKRFGPDHQEDIDIAALGARIAKDRALEASGNQRSALSAAAAAYARIYTRTHDHYPAINAATLYLLAGDQKRAHAYARRAVDASDHSSERTSIERYYRWVTRAEAALICRDIETARRALREAARHLNGHFDAAATTRRQLRLVCSAIETTPSILDALRPPAVLHYYGSAIPAEANRHLASQREREFIDKIVDHVTQHKIGYAYGSLTAGTEILCAEACLLADVELNIVLPFDQDEFVETAVRIAGQSWVRRFRLCLDRANSITHATRDFYQGDDELFTYACRLAMGMAILRARHLDTMLSQLRLQRAGSERHNSGYAASLRIWNPQKLPRHLLVQTEARIAIPRLERKAIAHAKRVPPRFARALLFGDVAGFSRTPDYLNPVFHKRFMGTIAAVLRKYRRHILYRNSWGDAIYIVMDNPAVAAECCLAIQEAITSEKPARFGMSPELALRLAAHFGPVYAGRDPIRNEPTFFGAHTTLVARMEPVTPPGHVYVTEAMAAALAMQNAPHLRVEYVGHVSMAKAFGPTRMYALKRSGKNENPA